MVTPAELTNFHHDGTANVLDVAVLHEVTINYELWFIPALGSDHNPVLLAVNRLGRADPIADVPTCTDTDWDAYSERLKSKIDLLIQIESVEELELEVSCFEHTI